MFFFLIQYKVVVRCLLLKIFENAMFSCNFSVVGLPTYSNPPIFTPIFDLVTAASDFRDFTPISETWRKRLVYGVFSSSAAFSLQNVPSPSQSARLIQASDARGVKGELRLAFLGSCKPIAVVLSSLARHKEIWRSENESNLESFLRPNFTEKTLSWPQILSWSVL